LYYSDAADFWFWAVLRTYSALEYFALASTSAASAYVTDFWAALNLCWAVSTAFLASASVLVDCPCSVKAS